MVPNIATWVPDNNHMYLYLQNVQWSLVYSEKGFVKHVQGGKDPTVDGFRLSYIGVREMLIYRSSGVNVLNYV